LREAEEGERDRTGRRWMTGRSDARPEVPGRKLELWPDRLPLWGVGYNTVFTNEVTTNYASTLTDSIIVDRQRICVLKFIKRNLAGNKLENLWVE
jgi:hypothetical protein